MNRRRKRYLRDQQTRRDELLDEANWLHAKLTEIEYEQSTGVRHLPLSFDSTLDWGTPISLRGAEQIRQYLGLVDMAISITASAIERDNLGSSAEPPQPGWGVSVIRN